MDEWVNMEAALYARFFSPSPLRAVREREEKKKMNVHARSSSSSSSVPYYYHSTAAVNANQSLAARRRRRRKNKTRANEKKNTTIDLPELIQARRRHRQSYGMRPRNVSNGPASILIRLSRSVCVFRSSLAIGKCTEANTENHF